jgi:hypothetical protein
MVKQTQNQYFGKESELPASLKKGSVYFCSDTNSVYNYGNGVPNLISLGTPLLTTGWASYEDITDLVGSPQIVLEGTEAAFVNRAELTNETQLPSGITSLWDSSLNRMTPALENDQYQIDFQFLAKNSKLSGYFTFDVDIPGVPGARFGTTVISPKGVGIEFPVTISFGHYTSSFFASGGGQPIIHSDFGTLSLYNKQIRYSRLHKGV